IVNGTIDIGAFEVQNAKSSGAAVHGLAPVDPLNALAAWSDSQGENLTQTTFVYAEQPADSMPLRVEECSTGWDVRAVVCEGWNSFAWDGLALDWVLQPFEKRTLPS